MVIRCNSLIQEVMVDGVLDCLQEQAAQKDNTFTTLPSTSCKEGFSKSFTRVAHVPWLAKVPEGGRAQSDTSWTPLVKRLWVLDNMQTVHKFINKFRPPLI